MQVIYSGGSMTSSISPRLLRKEMLTGGYIQPATNNLPPPPPSFIKPQSRANPSPNKNTSLRDFIPAMTKPVAITCLVCNIFLPGLGTFISGLTLICGSRVCPPPKSHSRIIWTNTWVACLQFLTTFLFLLGWIWSITWGISFLTIANDYSCEGKAKSSKVSELMTNPHGNTTTIPSTNHHSKMTTTRNKIPKEDIKITLIENPNIISSH